ncbi:hypothetical protein GHT06_009663 [Daphnia sinensis]|uniref:Proteasome assembly chaperone 4 n=1 Tax=Daphnia sinensis TaxID=1820382 RepID=A0AAD5L3J4_9CRUS|nr:hypothetical protein GHT06_009663 [Daphnia sinensis]
MSPIGIHQFSGKILDKNVCFQALKLTDQLVLWIGMESEPAFKDFALAMSTSYEKSPTTVKILGDASSLTSSTLASRLSKRCKKPVFVSFNISESNQELFTKIEERLLEEILISPESF